MPREKFMPSARRVRAWERMTLNDKLLHLEHRHGVQEGLIMDPDGYHDMTHGAVCEHEHVRGAA